jgi:YlmC/YmxH family sporulation protein
MVKGSELQAKDVINIIDGKRLGTIGDLDIDLESGLIRSIIVPANGKWFGWFGSGNEYVIPWNHIVKVGEDVVLVELRSSGSLAQDTAYLPPKSGGSSGGY